MTISATVFNSLQEHNVLVETNGQSKQVAIAGKPTGGSAVNGGELLFLSLATCFCNDLYREAAKRNINISSVTVTVKGQFGKEGEPASNISYHADVQCGSSPQEIQQLINYVDTVAEVHNTLRKGVSVTLLP